MSLPEAESAGEDAAEEECDGEREPVPTPLQDENDPVVSELYCVNDQLVTYAFRLLEQCITLSDAVAEINQKIHTVPLRKTDTTVEDAVQRESWKHLLSTWKSRVSCLGAEVVHVTADIRLSSIVETLHCDSPVDSADNQLPHHPDLAESCNTANRERADRQSTKAAPGIDSVGTRRAKSVAVPSQRPVASHRNRQQQLQQRQLPSTSKPLAPIKGASKKPATSVTQHDFAGKKATSTVTAGSNANNTQNASAAALAPDGPPTAGRRSLTKTASPPSDGKLVEMLARYREQVKASERANELKLRDLSPRLAADGANADRQWLPSLPEVTSSSLKRAKNSNEIGEFASSPLGGPPRSLTAFPGSINARSRDRRKY